MSAPGPTRQQQQAAWIAKRYTVKQLIEVCRRQHLPTRSGPKDEIISSLLSIGWHPPGYDAVDPYPRNTPTRSTLPPRSTP